MRAPETELADHARQRPADEPVDPVGVPPFDQGLSRWPPRQRAPWSARGGSPALDQQPSAWLDGSGHPREHRRTVPGDLVQQGAAGHQVVRVVWQLGRRAGRPGMAGVAVVRYVAQRCGQAEASTETMLRRGEHPGPLQRGRPSSFSLAASVRAGVVGSSPAPGRRRLIERLDLVPSQREGERFGIAGCLSPVLRTGDR